jgi:hypothetical protein
MAKMSRPVGEIAANISRRDFSRGVVLTAATAALPLAAAAHASGAAPGQEAKPEALKLSPEAESQVQALMSKYGNRLTDEQKADVRRLIGQAQKTSETMRAYPLSNADEPATIFRAYRAGKE